MIFVYHSKQITEFSFDKRVLRVRFMILIKNRKRFLNYDLSLIKLFWVVKLCTKALKQKQIVWIKLESFFEYFKCFFLITFRLE